MRCKSLFRKDFFASLSLRDGVGFWVFILMLACIGRLESKPVSTFLPEASDSISPKIFRHEFGLGAGTSTGAGLAYRIWKGKLGLQLLTLAYHTVRVEHYTFGFTFMHTIIRNDISNFFVYQSNRYRSVTSYREMVAYRQGGYQYTSAKTIDWANGIGLGYEIFRSSGKSNPIGISFMTGLATYRNFSAANLTAEISVMYKFNK